MNIKSNCVFYLYISIISFMIYKQYDKTIVLYNKLYPDFKKLSAHKQKYIAKNIIKSNVLELLSYLSSPVLFSVILNIGNFNHIIKVGAISYVANDFVALITVDKIPTRTKYHHIVSSTFCFYGIFLDFYKHDIAKLLFVYCITSCYSYNVNRFMAVRFLQTKKELVNLRLKGLIAYTIGCGLNWAYHIIWIVYNINDINLWICLYYILVTVLVYDDLYLMKWLYNYHC